jgi:hypothetical protein
MAHRRSYRSDAIYFDIEMTGPGRNVNEDSRRRIFGEKAGVDRIDLGKFIDLGAVNIALEDFFQSRAPAAKTGESRFLRRQIAGSNASLASKVLYPFL